MVFSSPGIRPNKKMYINCGSSARMADIVGVNEETRIKYDAKTDKTTQLRTAHISPAFKKKRCDQWQASPPTIDPFVLQVSPRSTYQSLQEVVPGVRRIA
ncbi:hypothetical protein [Absidia glauca]|uniref:Uncharacterized protein n=1 Tax=Absidia glauca TaxID=4829 RepID=A0A163L111_ABSGL|nr:hypothetical protein [Absidia glauca]